MISRGRIYGRSHPFVNLAICLLWLAASPTSIADPAPARESDEDFTRLSARLATLVDRLDQARQAIVRIQLTADSLPDVTAEDPDTAAERLAVTRQLIQDERRTLAALVASNSQLPESLSLSELEVRLRDSEAERDALLKQLETLNDPTTDPGTGYGSSRPMRDKTLVPLLVTKSRLVPATNDYFSARKVLCVNRVTHEQLACAEIKRVRDGTAVAIAIKDGALLDKMIKDEGLSPDSHIFYLHVCSDSVKSFHQLSRAIKARGYSFAWVTYRDRPVLRPLDGSVDDKPGPVDGY